MPNEVSIKDSQLNYLDFLLILQEVEDIKETSVLKRIEQATQCNISGKIFYERKLFKLALDQFETGARRLKLDSKVIDSNKEISELIQSLLIKLVKRIDLKKSPRKAHPNHMPFKI